jgi:hypothetical protein
VSLGCVVRVESTEQDLRRVGKDKSCRRMLPGCSPCEVLVAGTCDRERSWGGVSSWDEALGWEVL